MLFFAPSSAILKLVMKPSSFRIRAISILSLEAGTSTLGWRASTALRMRVSMSAIGSDVAIVRSPVILSLPTRLDHAGNFAGQGEFPETDPAQVEFANKAARPPATETTVAMADLVLQLLRLSNSFGCSCHVFLVFLVFV